MRHWKLIALACTLIVTAVCIGFAQDQNEPVSARKVIVKVQPQYPALARAAHIGGITRVMAHVNLDGKVQTVEVLGGHPLLAQAAVMAVNQWKWEPSSEPTKEIVIIRFSAAQ